ncbi:hypothetical protein A7P95_05160 [Eikenella longinqua]|uniref:Uncharacterized protein n=1 Tax=Eikenella longinqua TaxID=1795827 RepID=A0A1A9RXD7_9NEIS|nr:hypothetical protein A7P95_05160 [Eikenella longinqua]
MRRGYLKTWIAVFQVAFDLGNAAAGRDSGWNGIGMLMPPLFMRRQGVWPGRRFSGSLLGCFEAT